MIRNSRVSLGTWYLLFVISPATEPDLMVFWNIVDRLLNG
jgi:hypothetical protein